MSRSYKHTPVSKDCRRTSKRSKTLANRRLRRAHSKEWGTRKSNRYRRYCESWDIHDYVYRWTKEEAIAAWYNEEYYCRIMGYDLYSYGWHRAYKTLDRFINSCWRSCMLSK